jgi:hypothetical protein
MRHCTRTNTFCGLIAFNESRYVNESPLRAIALASVSLLTCLFYSWINRNGACVLPPIQHALAAVAAGNVAVAAVAAAVAAGNVVLGG